MKDIRYYNFTQTDTFSGSYSASTSGTDGISILTGDIVNPGDVIKLAAGTNAWSQDQQDLIFLSGDLTLSKVEEVDWTNDLKEKWLKSYLRHVKLDIIIDNNTQFNQILQLVEDINLFETISGPSVSYVTRSNDTSEVSVGLNVYENSFLLEYASTLPINSPLRTNIFAYHTSETVYISNAAKIIYDGYTELTWCFSGTVYDYDTSLLNEPSLTTGGGNIFSEVRLAGDGIQASYIIKKDVDDNDPTMGLGSGSGAPFCQGDEIMLIDTTVWTQASSGTSGWTWIGDFTVLDYELHLADVTDPCNSFKDIPISAMKFPMRIIQFCKFDNFN